MTIIRRVLTGTIVPAAVLIAYFVWTNTQFNAFYPTPQLIAGRFEDLWLFERVGSDVLPSLKNLFAGFSVAVLLGVTFGLILGRIRLLGDIVMPLVDFGRSVPAIMLIPPLVLVLGIGDSSKVAIIAIGAAFPTLLATIDGMRQTDPALLDVSRSIDLSTTKTIRHVWVPSALPSIFGGIQTSLQLSLVLMVGSEMVAAYRGLGYLTMQAQLTFDAPTLWSGLVLLALLGFSLNLIFALVRNRVLAWHIGMRAVSKSR